MIPTGTALHGIAGTAWLGEARRGKARQARRDWAKRGADWRGTAGEAGLVSASRGMAQQQPGQATAPFLSLFSHCSFTF
jgi:hypothetical protein